MGPGVSTICNLSSSFIAAGHVAKAILNHHVPLLWAT